MRSKVLAVGCLLIGLSVACNPPPIAPSDLVPLGTYQSSIAAVMGMGSGYGGVSVTPKASPDGLMDVDISVQLLNARPNATYFVQRAADVNRDFEADGICQRALGLPPWSANDPPAPSFATFPLGDGVATLSTTANGTGAATFEYRSLMIGAGTRFDVMFRLVDNETAPTTELRSGCFMVTVK